jgi:outer membrane protein assembly factor BamB
MSVERWGSWGLSTVRWASADRRARTWRGLIGLSATIAVAATLAGCGGASTRRSAPGASAAAAGSIGTWAAPDADLANTRRVGGPIDARSVGRLRVAWSVPLKGLYAATPVVVGGVAYTEDLGSNVYAIDAASGRLRWTRSYNQGDTGPNGVSVAGGRVFGVLPASAFALDARTGRELWSTRLIHSSAELIVMTPGVKDGTVYVSTVPGSAGAIGTLWALDAATGRRRWRWEEVPASLWGHPEVNGGGGLWHPPAFDERGDLYISIANPIPFPGIEQAPWGSSRPGPNRWDNSIVKLDARTGRFLWGTQVLPHDIYDWDLECPVILARARGRRIALSAGKLGFVYAFDAKTGAVLWKRSVGLHNGHDHDDLLAMHHQFSRLRINQPLLPGGWGGVETPMASDGRTIYVPVVNFPAIYRAMQFGPPAQADPITGRGELVALDIATGRVRWDRRLPHSPYGAATVANDLVFTTTYDGTVWALDRRSGAVRWSSRLPAGTDAPVAIAGDMLITAGSIPLGERQHPAIVAYRLGS